MKEGWEYIELSKKCKVQNGFAFNSKDFNCINGLPLIRIRDIKRGFSETYTNEYCSSDYIVENGDLLVGMDGDFNVGIWKGGHALLNQRVCMIKPLNNYNIKFLYYYLPNILNRINQKTSFSTVKHLSSKQVNKINIPDIILDEQRRIVSYLDSSFKLIDEIKNKALKSLTEAKALFQSALAEAMEPKEGWEEKTLKEVAKYRRGSFPQPYGKKEWYDGEGSMPFVQVADLQEDNFDLNDITKKRISKKAQEFSVFVKKGTVLVSLQGSIGKVAITQYDSYVDRTVAIFFKIDDFLNKYFFAIQLKLRFEIERVKARGTTIKTITKEEFSNFSINIPPLSTQKQIVSHLDKLSSKVRAIEEKFQKMVEECDALKQAMLRDVFE